MAFSNLYGLLNNGRRGRLVDRLATPSTASTVSSVRRSPSPSRSRAPSPSRARSASPRSFATPMTSPRRSPSQLRTPQRTPSVTSSRRSATPSTLPRTPRRTPSASGSSRRSASNASYTQRKGATALKMWMMALFKPTSDYYLETISGAGLAREDAVLAKEANTLLKVKRALNREISKTSPSLVVDMVRRADLPPQEELFEMLTPDDFKRVYVTFEKRRIANIGKVARSPWTLALKSSSKFYTQLVKEGKVCDAGKVVNPATGRCKKADAIKKRSPKKSPKRSAKKSPKKSPKRARRTSPKVKRSPKRKN